MGAPTAARSVAAYEEGGSVSRVAHRRSTARVRRSRRGRRRQRVRPALCRRRLQRRSQGGIVAFTPTASTRPADVAIASGGGDAAADQAQRPVPRPAKRSATCARSTSRRPTAARCRHGCCFRRATSRRHACPTILEIHGGPYAVLRPAFLDRLSALRGRRLCRAVHQSARLDRLWPGLRRRDREDLSRQRLRPT